MSSSSSNSWWVPVALIALATIVVETFMLLTDMGPNLAIVGALCVLAGAAVWATMSVFDVSVDSAPLPPVSIGDPTARPDSRLSTLRSDLAYSRHNDRTAERVYLNLVDLIDDQLQAVHGVDRHTDPAAAQALLGPELSLFISDGSQASRLTRPRELITIITLIENV